MLPAAARPATLSLPPPLLVQARRQLHTFKPSQLVAVLAALAAYPPEEGGAAGSSGWHPGRLLLFDFVSHSSPAAVMGAWSGQQAAQVLWAFSRFRCGHKGAQAWQCSVRERSAELSDIPPAHSTAQHSTTNHALLCGRFHAGMCQTLATCVRCCCTWSPSCQPRLLAACPWRCGAWQRCSSRCPAGHGARRGATRRCVFQTASARLRWRAQSLRWRRCSCGRRQS